MRIPDCVTRPLARWAVHYMMKRPPDQLIMDELDTYILIRRWDVFDLPGFHVRLHQILGSDEDRDLHDHPWWNITALIQGNYNEVVPVWKWWEWLGQHGHWITDGTVARRRWCGAVVFRTRVARHRIVLDQVSAPRSILLDRVSARHRIVLDRVSARYDPPVVRSALTLFIHGPNTRCWGFWNDQGEFRPAKNQRRMR